MHVEHLIILSMERIFHSLCFVTFSYSTLLTEHVYLSFKSIQNTSHHRHTWLKYSTLYNFYWCITIRGRLTTLKNIILKLCVYESRNNDKNPPLQHSAMNVRLTVSTLILCWWGKRDFNNNTNNKNFIFHPLLSLDTNWL